MEPKNYTAALDELQQIVNDLQAEKIAIDDLAAKVKRAGDLVAFCREKLRTVEDELNELWDQDQS